MAEEINWSEFDIDKLSGEIGQQGPLLLLGVLMVILISTIAMWWVLKDLDDIKDPKLRAKKQYDIHVKAGVFRTAVVAISASVVMFQIMKNWINISSKKI